MATEVRRFACTIPAGTAVATPLKVPMAMPPREVIRLDVLVPPGPRGNMGFQIGSGGIQILPLNAGAYVVTDDEQIEWPLAGQINSGAWQLIGWNVGQYDHTVYVTFLLDQVIQAVAAAPSAALALAGTEVLCSG